MNVEERWEQGTPHDPRSEILARELAKIDEQNGDLFCFKFGGDGDNGELLMYLLDIYFQEVLPANTKLTCPKGHVERNSY